jgi:hypothetical protein
MSKIEVNEIDAQSGSTITVGSACKSVAVPGNVVKTNAVQASDAGNIISQSGTTITIGASGDTVSLASGASQSGFGRSGSVDWETTKKTANFDATSGEGYFVDTTGGAITMTLPASPSAGDIVAAKDYDGTFGTNNFTINRNSEPINGGNAINPVIDTSGASIVLVYVDATQGWVPTQDDSSAIVGENFMSATGGTITTCGNDKIHTFTGPGTFTVCSVSDAAANNIVSYVIVGGGGGGGGAGPGPACGGAGGGGAGGYREVKNPVTPYTASPLDGYPSAPNRVTVTATGFPITVGAGGAGGAHTACGSNGATSTFSTITAARGGYGGAGATSGGNQKGGGDGGSGGGGGGANGTPPGVGSGGTGNVPPVSPAQGNNGGTAPVGSRGGGSGGGATAAGGACAAGGAGATSSITGSANARAGGGGNGRGAGEGSCGGAGGGGAGNKGGDGGTPAQAGSTNTGGGGGGAGDENSAPCRAGGNGGSGIVIIRYRFQ